MKSVGTDIRTTIRGPLPRIPFAAITKLVLGQRYELSLVVCADDLARAINGKYRKKHYAANVLSFPLSRTEGEIFLNVRAARREARKYGVTMRHRLGLLFVHGLLHLKALPHGRTMEREERRILRMFGLSQ